MQISNILKLLYLFYFQTHSMKSKFFFHIFMFLYLIYDVHYFHICRWWFEQIGFWGAPGTAPSDEVSAVGIRAINVPAESSPDAYKERYPNGFTASYSTSAPASTVVATSGLATIIIALFIFLAGLGIGGGLAVLAEKNRSPYLPLN